MKKYTITFREYEWGDSDMEEHCEETAIVEFEYEIPDNMAERLESSYASGKYQYLYEDKSIGDIYSDVCDTIEQISRGDSGEVDYESIEYPEELFHGNGK